MVASQFSMVGSQIQPASRRVTVLNTAGEMKAASREDQKEENKEPTRNSYKARTTRVPARSMSDLKTSSSGRPRGLPPSLCLLYFLPLLAFFIVLSCRDLPVEKPPLGVPLMRQSDTRVVVCACIRTRRLFSLLAKRFFFPCIEERDVIFVRKKLHT